MTKRMNYPEVDLAKVVASYEDVYATSRDIPLLKNKTAIGGLDFASIKDFAAVGLLFKQGDDVIWVTHSFARKEYLDSANLRMSGLSYPSFIACSLMQCGKTVYAR